MSENVGFFLMLCLSNCEGPERLSPFYGSYFGSLYRIQIYGLSYNHSFCLSAVWSPHEASVCDRVVTKLLIRLELSHCSIQPLLSNFLSFCLDWFQSS